jgi:hypothetical protein
MWAKMPALLVAGAVAFVWGGLALAWGGAAVQLVRTIPTWSGWEATGVGVALGWGAICAAGLLRFGRRWSDRIFVAVATLLALAAGLGWAWLTRGMGYWPMDSGFFRWFLDRLATGGWRVENLRTLTDNYDYGAWTTRAWPLYFPLRLLSGPDAFGWAVQTLQAFVGAACVPLAWRIVRLLCGERAARWTAAALVAMPGFAMQAVGLNHQVLGACEYLAATCLLAEWMFGDGTAWKKVSLTVGMCVLAATACFEGSAWTLFLLSAMVLLSLECIRPDGRRLLAAVALGAMVLFPVWIGRTVAGKVLVPAAEANPESINGGSLAFMARGWDFEWGGEYSDAIQTVDVLTPRVDKERFFTAYLAGQCAYNGPALVSKLFPAKLAKFLLAGYASLAEEVLWANGAERTARVARGMRVGWFVLLYAPLMLWGLWRLVRLVEDVRTAWLVLPVALFGVAVMFAGETSPRYSMPVQALLLAAGACGFTGEDRKEKAVLRHPFASGMVVVATGYLLFSSGLLSLRGTWEKLALTDMRTALLEGGRVSDNPRLVPFDAVFPDGKGSIEWLGRGGGGVIYCHGVSWREHGRIEVEEEGSAPCEMTLPVRLELMWPDDVPRRVSFHRLEGGDPLHVGYAEMTPPAR